jgi:tRNA-uridine 2-sulfurtransferase
MKKKVIVGLSGGVDSSVAAWKLIQEGYEVSAMFMRNWNDSTGLLQSECHWEDDLMFAEMVAKRLGIRLHFVDLSEQYRKRVVDYMFSEYAGGRTPNPDVLCNREIKFDSFSEEVRKLGGELVATGHYCRKALLGKRHKEVFRLLAGIDENKDQSYFLCQLSQAQLAGSLFPVGDMTKSEVRRIASELGLPTAQRKDSQGICFVGKVNLPAFLQQKLESRPGKIVEIPADERLMKWGNEMPPDDAGEEQLKYAAEPHHFNPLNGKTIGSHSGAHFFTVGQRKGINVGGHREPLFVLGTDVADNLLYVGEGQSHPGLHRKGLFVKGNEIHWIRPDLEMELDEVREYSVRIRYRQPLQKARLFRKENGIYIVFNKLQRGIAPGQFAAWYHGEELIGSGVIDR